MHALINKNNKSQTPQEIYRAKKQKEEEERNAFLPPGLVNHGNTCFMNSVLQGLIATPMLADIVRFHLPDSYAPAIAARRSPQLTNGHGRGGPAEKQWEQGMPLGDVFVSLMERAWKIQEERERVSMSPRELLARIGAKYDQYLDFRQQDAHELLRHLLDAMRMEELDIIKKRQPPSPKNKRRLKTNFKNVNSSSGNQNQQSSVNGSIPEEDRLVSFVDMVFGGQLASILVCEKCKKVSCTYEDFNDLSLSIKLEDYMFDNKIKKRDRLKIFARKLGMRGRGPMRELDIPDDKGPRSSSVPASPTRRSEEAERSFELVMNDVERRRRSLEVEEEAATLLSVQQDESKPELLEVNGEHSAKHEQRVMLGVVEEQGSLKEDTLREREEDGWVKLRRRFSAGVVKKKGKKGIPKDAARGRVSNDESEQKDDTIDSFVDVKMPSPSPISPTASPLLGATIALQKLAFSRKPSPSRMYTASPSISTVTSPSRSPEIPPVSLPLPTLQSPSPSPVPSPAPPSRPKTPSQPKHSRSESAYLRRLLADVPVHTNSPFNIFRNGALTSSTGDISDNRSIWSKLSHEQSVEGCLKLFTSVEVLDGENMVGCRRCWKIQHGQYVPHGKDGNVNSINEKDCDSSSEDSSNASVKIDLVDEDVSNDTIDSANSPSANGVSDRLEDARQLFPIQTSSQIPFPTTSPINVPSISMTVPERDTYFDTQVKPSIDDERNAAYSDQYSNPRRKESSQLSSSPSRDSLQLPPRHFRQPAERRNFISFETASDTSSISSDEPSADELDETETSLTMSLHSESSSIASSTMTDQPVSDRIGYKSPITPSSREKSSKSSSIPRAKQVILRRAYKRYLIATPPPVLVIHLKRFQQSSSSPVMFQSLASFKKLEDPVSFSEYLDLSPFLMPSKDELIGESRKKKRKEKKRKSKEKDEDEDGTVEADGDDSQKAGGPKSECYVYRLYAVVVHIGNMLGGHYIAYTALPEAEPLPSDKSSDDVESSFNSLPSSSSSGSNKLRPEIPRTTSFLRSASPEVNNFKRRSSNVSTKTTTQRQWCYVSDTTVRLASLEEVLKAKAYICMYERLT